MSSGHYQLLMAVASQLTKADQKSHAISCRVFEKSALSRVDLGDIAPAMDSENFAS